jgi:hypothetical protein
VRELFVWYRVDPRNAHAARVAVAAMQEALVAHWPGLRTRLLVRADPGQQTWMETYARPSGGVGVDGTLDAAIATAALPLRSLIDGERHVEAFDAASSH